MTGELLESQSAISPPSLAALLKVPSVVLPPSVEAYPPVVANERTAGLL